MHFLSSKLQRDVTTQQLSYSSSESENDTFLTILCCQVCWLKARTTNVVRNAGCARSRYTQNFFKIN